MLQIIWMCHVLIGYNFAAIAIFLKLGFQCYIRAVAVAANHLDVSVGVRQVQSLSIQPIYECTPIQAAATCSANYAGHDPTSVYLLELERHWRLMGTEFQKFVGSHLGQA